MSMIIVLMITMVKMAMKMAKGGYVMKLGNSILSHNCHVRRFNAKVEIREQQQIVKLQS